MNFYLLDNAASASAETAGQSQQGQIWIILGMYALLALAIYFFIFRPNKKKKKAEEEMKNSLEVGDEITTIGGIMGRVVSMKDDDSLIIETASDRSKIRIRKWAVSSIDSEKDTDKTKLNGKTADSDEKPDKKDSSDKGED